MRTHLHLFGLLFTSLLASGCNPVFVKHPIGEPISEDTESLADKFDGAWLTDGNPIYLKYVPAGKLRVATLSWDENKQKFVKEEETILLTTHHGAHYMNSPESQCDQGTQYRFVRYTFAADNSLVIWQPRAEAFEKAVRNRELKGAVEETKSTVTFNGGSELELSSNVIRVTATKDEVLKFIRDGKFTEQFEVEDPIVLRKLGTSK